MSFSNWDRRALFSCSKALFSVSSCSTLKLSSYHPCWISSREAAGLATVWLAVMDIILLIAEVFSTPFMQQGYGQRAPVSGLWSRGLAHLRAGANQLARLLLHDGGVQTLCFGSFAHASSLTLAEGYKW